MSAGSGVKMVPADTVARQAIAPTSVGSKTINGLLAGFGIGLFGAGVALTMIAPAQPGKQFAKLVSTYVPLMTIAGGLFSFTDAAMELNNVDSEIKRGATSGCVAGFTYGIHRSSLSSAFLGCAVVGGAVGGYELSKRLSGSPDQAREFRRVVGAPSPSSVIREVKLTKSN